MAGFVQRRSMHSTIVSR